MPSIVFFFFSFTGLDSCTNMQGRALCSFALSVKPWVWGFFSEKNEPAYLLQMFALWEQELGCFVISSLTDTDQTLTFTKLSDDLIIVPSVKKFFFFLKKKKAGSGLKQIVAPGIAKLLLDPTALLSTGQAAGTPWWGLKNGTSKICVLYNQCY